MHTAEALGRHHFGRRRLTVATLVVAICVPLALVSGPTAVANADPLPWYWVAQGSGVFTTETDPTDKLSYRVEAGAIRADQVEFRLEDFRRCAWWKELRLSDGLGWQRTLRTEGSTGRFTDSDRLWAWQVHNGQQLRFFKAGFLGFPRWVMNVDINEVPPGSRVVFRWLSDSVDC